MKGNIKSKVYFVLVFCLTLVIAATHQNEFPRFLLGFEALLIFALFLCVCWMGSRLDVSMKTMAISVKRREELRVEVRLKNKGKLPMPEVRVQIVYEDLLTGMKGMVHGNAMLDEYGEAILCFRLAADHCGVVSFRLEQVRVVDYLGIFHRKCKCKKEVQEIAVLPEDDAEFKDMELDGAEQVGDDKGMALQQRGDDPAEIYDIRKYQQGDTMHRIHWKMSAKTDELLVREFGESLELVPLILLDLKRQSVEITRDQWDYFLGVVAAFSTQTLRAGLAHYVAWLDKEHLGMVRFLVSDEEKLEEMLMILVRAHLYETGDIGAYYKESYGDETLGEIIQIDVTGKFIRD